VGDGYGKDLTAIDRKLIMAKGIQIKTTFKRRELSKINISQKNILPFENTLTGFLNKQDFIRLK
jgi:hypothetical protein